MSETTTETTTADEVLQAEVPGATADDYIQIVLAHPLENDDLQRIGLGKHEKAPAGSTIAVLRDHARAIIGAGYARVDSEDPQAVADALAGNSAKIDPPADPEPAEQPSLVEDVATSDPFVADQAPEQVSKADETFTPLDATGDVTAADATSDGPKASTSRKRS